MQRTRSTRPTAPSLHAEHAPSGRATALGRAVVTVERALRRHVLGLLFATAALAFLAPAWAMAPLAKRHLFSLPYSRLHYEPRTLALALMVLAASVRYRPRDLVRVFRTGAGFANLLSVYVVVPAVTVCIAIALMLTGNGALSAIGTGLVLAAMMPVAMTSTVWTRAARGSVSLSLGTVALSSAAAVVLLPIALGRLPSAFAAAPTTETLRDQVVCAFALPLVFGMTLRSAAPEWAGAIARPLSLVSVVALLLSVADCAGALRPQLVATPALLVAATLAALGTNALAFLAGHAIARARGLSHREAISVTLASGMRSTPAAMIVAALSFPHAPLVALAPMVWSVSQQLLAGVVARRLLQLEPVDAPTSLPGRAWPPARSASARSPALAATPSGGVQDAVDLEESLVMPLLQRFTETVDEDLSALVADTVQAPQRGPRPFETLG